MQFSIFMKMQIDYTHLNFFVSLSKYTVLWTKFRSPSTVNSRLAETPLLRTLAIKDKIQIPIYRALTENDSGYHGLSLFLDTKRRPEGVRYNESWLYIRKWNKEVEVSVIDLHFHENNELYSLLLGLSVPDESPRI